MKTEKDSAFDPVTFWKYYGRELEVILEHAHKAESERLSKVILQGNHHLYLYEKYSMQELGKLKMIRSVVIEMNRDERIDSQVPKE